MIQTGITDAAESTGSTNVDFILNDKQYDFVQDDASKFAFYVGGIGAGKTFAGGLKAIRKAVGNAGSLGLIGAPTYPMLRDATMRTFFELLPEELIAEFSITNAHLKLINGSEILFRSMDAPDRIRGLNLAWFWLDEAPLCGYYAWQILKGRLRQHGYEQQGFATGSPKGRDGFARDFELEPKPGHVLYRASTRENLPNLPETFIEDLGYSGDFALQEVDGLFVAFEGLVYGYRSEWHNGEWVKIGEDGNPRRPALRIGGVDWGFTNPAVALPMYVDHDDRVFVLDEFYQRNVGLTGASQTVGEGGLSQAILQFSREYGIETWYCGPDEPEHINALNAMFGRHNLKARAVAANDEIMPGIETMRRQMALRADGTVGLRVSARCPNTKAEFQTYRFPDHKEGGAIATTRDPQDKPVKAFDHAMDGSRYAIHTVLGNRALRSGHNIAQMQPKKAPPISNIGGVRVMRKVF